MKKTLITTIGFLLFLIGFLSLLLMLTGLKLTYLSFIDAKGDFLGFLIRITMIIMGIILVYVSRINTQEKRD
jgi:hypothetical protein